MIENGSCACTGLEKPAGSNTKAKPAKSTPSVRGLAPLELSARKWRNAILHLNKTPQTAGPEAVIVNDY